ncbi:DUF4190 domain-containing protein [Nocardia blacklockiae]|uniref:DUF4190 domain-containing protein n=1 Tax=Nocardia blacklockiae TaxID=480036 RepID=UPI0018951894|nr:DUF4190 domain-containing protein [Nocardia blacklockiae]MBF6176430.1 hypothetical protein [Nocardia blacklockiae]
MVRRLPAEPERRPVAPDDERWPVAEPDEGWDAAPNGRRAPMAAPAADDDYWEQQAPRRAPADDAPWQGAPNGRYAAEPDAGQDRWEAARNRRRQVSEPDDEYWESPPSRRRADPEDEERWDNTQSRRRTGRLRVEVPPIVNPYSIIALIAALLGLFPVALVFGLISFGHPRGRAMAMFALLIGILEVVALAGALVLTGVTLPRTSLGSEPTPTAATTVVTVTAAPTTAPALTTPVATTPAAAAPPSVAKGETCTQAQAGLIGAGSDGSTLLCLRGGGGYRWAGPYTVTTAVHEGGTKCLPGTDTSARTTDGHALVCEGRGSGTWTLWVE